MASSSASQWQHGACVWPVTASEYHAGQGRAASKADLSWKANALRHSFISYRLAQTKDMAAVALEAGNSPTMIFRALPGIGHRRGGGGLVRHPSGQRR